MLLSEIIEELHLSVESLFKIVETKTVNTRILYAVALINECVTTNNIVEDYYQTIINGQLPEELKPELNNWLNIDSWYLESAIFEESTYTACSNNIEPMQYVTISIDSHDIVNNLSHNIHKLVLNLNKLKLLLKKPTEELYEEYWHKLQQIYPKKRTIKLYKEWREENDATDVELLKDKIIQETVQLLETDVFSYYPKISKREIMTAKLILTEESLYSDKPVTDYIRIHCAKLSRFIKSVADNGIPIIDCHKLSSYLYKHHNQMTQQQRNAVINYTYLIELIHVEIIALNPSTCKKLCDNREYYFSIAEKECLQILAYCNSLLQPTIKKDFVYNLWQELMANEKLKKEIFDSITGQSKYTTICNIIGALLANKRIYLKETTSTTIAKILKSQIPTLNEPTLKRYINNGVSNYRTSIYRFIESYIETYLKKH